MKTVTLVRPFSGSVKSYGATLITSGTAGGVPVPSVADWTKVGFLRSLGLIEPFLILVEVTAFLCSLAAVTEPSGMFAAA